MINGLGERRLGDSSAQGYLLWLQHTNLAETETIMNTHSMVICYFSKYLKKNPYNKKRNIRKKESSLSFQMLGNSNDEDSIFVEQKRIDVLYI